MASVAIVVITLPAGHNSEGDKQQEALQHLVSAQQVAVIWTQALQLSDVCAEYEGLTAPRSNLARPPSTQRGWRATTMLTAVQSSMKERLPVQPKAAYAAWRTCSKARCWRLSPFATKHAIPPPSVSTIWACWCQKHADTTRIADAHLL